jgi:hypothetical protein
VKNIGAMVGREKVSLLNEQSNEFILPTTEIGVEIELENVIKQNLEKDLSARLQNYWDYHEDNSLHERGMEFTFKQPFYGKDASEAIRGLLELAVKREWTPSLRTGIHVHLDVRDLHYPQLLGLLTYYILFEPAIYAWVAEGRESNNFCVPWYKSEKSLDDAVAIMNFMREYVMGKEYFQDKLVYRCREFHRYAGLNLKAIAEYGSLEFRHLKTTLKYERIKSWINIIFSLKRMAAEAPESTIAIINGVRRRGVVPTLHYVFGTETAKEMIGLDQDLVRKINELAIPNAIEFIGNATNAQQEDELIWDVGVTPGGKKRVQHPGWDLWRKANFPKGQDSTEEALEKLKQFKKAKKKPTDRLYHIENNTLARIQLRPARDGIIAPELNPPPAAQPEPWGDLTRFTVASDILNPVEFQRPPDEES